MHTNRYKYVSIVSAVAVLLLLALYMWMTYRSTTKDITERAGNQLTWAMFYESYTRAHYVTQDDTLSLPEARSNISLASSVEGMNDALSKDYHSEISLDTVALYVDSLLSVAEINRNVTLLEIDAQGQILRKNNDRNNSWSLLTQPISIRRDQSKAIQLALNNPYPELAQRLSPLFLLSAFILGFFAIIIVQLLKFITEQEQLAELRNDFSYAMVHDMKSPLSSIIMGAHFLHSGKVDDKPQIKEKYYTIIEEEAEHLLTLVNKLLTISKLENKKLILNKWDIDIEPIIADLIDKTKAKATKPLEIVTDLKIRNVLADEQYLTEAIANLLDNAIKFAAPGSCLLVRLYRDMGKAYVSIKDYGETIPPDDLPYIFDRFHKSDRSRSVDKEGVGLGLYLVKTIINAHDEDIAVRSEDGMTEFVFTLPLAANMKQGREKP